LHTAAAADTRPQSWAMTKQALQLGKPLSSLTHEDCLRYHAFHADPQPSATWVAGSGRKHPRGDARWSQFYGLLSPASIRQATVILNVLFS
jgi:integrase/recombinase XerD